jgi:peptidoglycan/xylan/chitin deacetylase (PgdA/CDA1 family)
VDRYLELDKGLPSTFFLIPFKGYPGRSSEGMAPGLRAAGYGAKDIADLIAKIGDAGCEVGLHGLDAWIDSSKGREEIGEIRRLTKTSEIGVRMHWLYYDQQSPMELENAGAAYDSTVGYRDTVGYRSGTTQAYKPIHALHLLELPMHIMDTALYYPTCLNLSQQCAVSMLERIVGNVAKLGGCITVNWHDRSLAPERNWESSYRELVAELKSQGAWFATAGQTCSWFRKRRSVVFHAHDAGLKGVNVNPAGDDGNALPGLRVRVYEARESCQFESYEPNQYVESTIGGSVAVPDLCGARG